MYLFGYRHIGDGDTDRREILHNGTYRSACLGGAVGSVTVRAAWLR